MADEASQQLRTQGAVTGWGLMLAGVSVAALGGYAGFRWAAALDLSGQAGAGLVALAAVTGFAVFFSPCSFPLLVGMLAGPNVDPRQRRPGDAVRSALAVGLGASMFLLLVGAVVGLVGDGIADHVGFSTTGGRALRGTVAGVLVVAGLVQLGRVSVPLGRVVPLAGPLARRRVDVAARSRRGGQVLYGFGFVLAGFG